ncbi:MAG: type II secretion system F family protein [Candidatus Omnitrophica bacterium]|nr:type II secretion system F family protein [Candidatus Omnitrophota bacterium]
MPKFVYTVKSNPSETIQGDIEAESEQEAVNKLMQLGYFPLRLEAQHVLQKKDKLSYFRKISKRDIFLFTQQLASLIESGVNILNAFKVVIKQTSNKQLRVLLNDASAKIKDGKSLSESLSAYPKVFSSLYTSIIMSGETSGKVEDALSRLAQFLEKEEEFKNSIRSSLAYPVFVFIVGALTVIVLMGFVIPRLVTMFEDMGQALPLPTKILIETSGFLRSYWWLIAAAFLILMFTARRLRATSAGKYTFDRLKLKLPVIGEIIMKTEVGRFTRTLAILISSGIPVVSSLNIAGSIIENQILKREIKKFKDEITAGSSFSKCLATSKLFPDFVTNIISVGEEAGSLEKALLRIAGEYERDVDRSLKAFTRLLEPFIILVMGLIVGFIVLSMLLPIFQMNLIVR